MSFLPSCCLMACPKKNGPCHTFYKKYFLSAVEKNNKRREEVFFQSLA